MLTLQWMKADITELEVDAIVNAANGELRPGGGVCGAIHRKAGPELAAACMGFRHTGHNKEVRCRTGSAVTTPGFRLKAKWCIHAVGPVYSPARQNWSRDTLYETYAASLKQARKFQCYTVAFPALSCGIYGYPVAEGIKVGIDSIRNTGLKYPNMDHLVTMVGFDPEVCSALELFLGPPAVSPSIVSV